MTGVPLVSCIMPTYNRRQFVPRAIDYFLRQDYPNRELVIVDDGSDSIADLVPPDEHIRYVKLDQRATLGAKRNLACQNARGELIMHWDDDDWHAPRRISTQVAALLEQGGEICGLRQMLFCDLRSGALWMYEYPASERRWLIGGSLLYHRRFWERTPFLNIQMGEDTRFLWSQDLAHAVVLSDYSIYIALIHSANTSHKNTQAPYWRRWDGDLAVLLGKDWQPLVASAAILPAGRREQHSISKEMPELQHALHQRKVDMKLNLLHTEGSQPGYINVSSAPHEQVDMVADLTGVWPWGESTVQSVRALDLIEHLPDKIHTMNELWRVLVPGGQAEIAVPTTDGTGAFQDPTHISYWNRRSFLYYEAGNSYRERFARYYGIQARFRVVQEHIASSPDGPILNIVLEAVKS